MMRQPHAEFGLMLRNWERYRREMKTARGNRSAQLRERCVRLAEGMLHAAGRR